MRAQKELFFFPVGHYLSREKVRGGGAKFQNTEFLAEKMFATVLDTMINVKRLKELNKSL